MVWCVELRKDNGALVEQGQEANVEIKGGSNTIDALKQSIFPNYDARARGHVIIYSSSASAAEKSKKKQWQEEKPRDSLRENNASNTYGYIDPNQQGDASSLNEPPAKKRKIRDSRDATKVEAHKCVDLNVGTDSDIGRYYGREGMSDLFLQLVDSRDGEKEFNVEFIGAPGTGKRNLVWAVAEYLCAVKKQSVIWASRRFLGEPWIVIQFLEGSVYQYDNLPETLSDILKLQEFSKSSVLILDSPISIADNTERQNGTAAFIWASQTAVRGGRIGSRRVIHVSSLGASTQKAEERHHLNLHEIRMRPWTRKDFIKALDDQQLKLRVCATLEIDHPASVTAEELVDSKFFYSGINARWFFNHSIQEIKDECEKILDRMSPGTVSNGGRHCAAVNSALQRYWLDGRPVVLFTSSYLAKTMGRSSQTAGQKQFLVNFPLIKEYLGNGAPGEIFKADFAIHLQHCHDLANAQRVTMGNQAQHGEVLLGKIDDGTAVLWPTGNLYKLPPISNTESFYQKIPDEATRELYESVAKWFIPESKSQPFLDFFVLVPDGEKWQFRAIQNTAGKKHSADVEKLKYVVAGVIESGFNLCDEIVVASIIEDRNRHQHIGLPDNSRFNLSRTAGSRSEDKGNGSQDFTVEVLHVTFTPAGDIPL